jgi:hypothetical protein
MLLEKGACLDFWGRHSSLGVGPAPTVRGHCKPLSVANRGQHGGECIPVLLLEADIARHAVGEDSNVDRRQDGGTTVLCPARRVC